jgi:UDP-glucose 4-epimerase
VKVLVTGGSGWIGQATCRALERAGHEPVVFDRAHGADVRDPQSVSHAIREVDHVIHLAGLLGTHELFARPLAAAEVNVMGSLNVTAGCAEHGVALTEITMPRVNPSLYAATKACAMDIALAYVAAGRLQASFVRAYNAYGPGQAYGGDHPQKIVPTFASKAWAGEPLPVWGDGSLLTDLVHVDDVARMLVEAMAFGDGETFDAGTGYAQPVLNVALRVGMIVEQEGGPDETVIDHLPARIGERTSSTDADFASGAEGWHLLGGWRPVFDPQRFREAVLSYRPKTDEIAA